MHSPEKKVCQHCQTPFTVDAADFAFYDKIHVPSPALCPACRAQRRLAFRNERVFYKRPCDRCSKDIISMYSPNKSYTVWCYDCWFADTWDARDYGRPHNPARPFFDQCRELWQAVPKVALVHVRSVNSEYLNISADNKDCYMIIESSNNENCTHCYWVQQCRDCVDVSFAHQTELSYESDDCYNSYKLRYSKGCHNCRESYFLLDCRDCTNCIGCVNLRSRQYCIFNKQVSRQAYEEFCASLKLETATGVEDMRKRFSAFARSQPCKYAEIVNAPGCTGNYIKNAKNCVNCFHCYDAEDCKYNVHVWRNAKDIMDCDTIGIGAQMMYNATNTALDSSHCLGTAICWSCAFMEYCSYCFNSTNCFGCTGLRKQNYCILNKQYDKATFEKLRADIVQHMKGRGEYGEFFPTDVSTFGYNESAAQEQFPLTKEDALRQGFKWEDHPRGTYGKETVQWKDVPDSIHDYRGDIVTEIFACVACNKNYRVIPSELAFYQRLGIPLPRHCPDCRHARRFAERGPNRLWRRVCQCTGTESGIKNQESETRYKNTAVHFHGEKPCPNEFEASHSQERQEIVYCEACYNAEVV